MLKKKLKSNIYLKSLFNSLNIKKNDNIVLHSNIAGLYQFEGKIQKKHYIFFLNFILNFIGKNGTLLVPTYNYDFTKGIPYNRKKTNSQVGAFGNALIKKYFKLRTFDPIFSHLVFGKLKKEIFSCKHDEAFGEKSVFAKLKKKNFKIICFCCSTNNITYLHYLEKKFNVKYRFNKIFKVIDKKKKLQISKYYVGKKNYNYSLKEKNILNILNNKEFRQASFGRFKSYSVTVNYLFNKIKDRIHKKNNYLISN